jgi:hypothetical protein
MTLNPAVMTAVERLDYRVTVADVAAQAGIDLNTAQQGVLALAADTQAHMQVSDEGEIAYAFPKSFRAILRNKSLRLRLQATWDKVAKVLFYLVRISFGVLLVVSIVLIVAAIIIIITAANSSKEGNNRSSSRRGGGGMGLYLMPRMWFGPSPFRVMRYNYRPPAPVKVGQKSELNFFEAIYSFLFGDGDPNADLEEERWRKVATVIRNAKGAITAEQVAPYLDELGDADSQAREDYMLPVLSRFNGQPQVSPEGGIIYHFPELQVSAAQWRSAPVSAYLKEDLWQFSQATQGQISMAIGLGAFNFIGAIVLGTMIQDPELVAELGGLVAFVSSIYWLLLGYGTAFLSVPLVRYFWLKRRNKAIDQRNQARQERAAALSMSPPAVQEKLDYARQFASETVVKQENLAYTTESDLIEQEAEQSDKLDAEWRRRLGRSQQ